jgi:hypothetical protein
MAASKELRAWAATLRGWALLVETDTVREQMIQLAAQLESLAQCKEAAERQFV